MRNVPSGTKKCIVFFVGKKIKDENEEERAFSLRKKKSR